MNIESRMLMNIHKIEKAIFMPNRYVIFSQNIIKQIIEDFSHDVLINNSVLNQAYQTISKYRDCLDISYNENKEIVDYINKNLNQLKKYHKNNILNETLPYSKSETNSFEVLSNIISCRHSVRNYTKQKVPIQLLYKAVDIANSLPCACNRQACSLVVIENETIKDNLLLLQTGNKGFSAPTLAAIIVNKNIFTQDNEKNALSFHAGSFTAGFVLALQSLNVSSCLLNWYVDEDKNNKAKELLNLSQIEQEIAVLIFIGYSDNSKEAQSFKKNSRDLVEILK